MEDVVRLDQMIGRYFSIALTVEQDFDRALKAAYVVLALTEMKTTLLGSNPTGTP
jgi:hypothetical protein